MSCANPLIAAASPAQGYSGDRITVTGTGFGEAGTLLIGGTEAKVERWSATSIVGYIPPAGGGAVVVQCGSASSDRTPGAPSVRVTVKPTPNLPPDAVGYALPKKRVPGGQVFQLDGRASSDPDGRVVAWQWKLGTKVVSDKPLFSRRFPGYARAYVLTLTVRDNKGASATTVARLRTVKKTPPKVEQPTEIKIVAPSDLLFGFDSCVVSGAGRSYLTKLRPLVVKSVFVSLAGHTDWAGDDAYNLELGRCRAQAVEKVLFAGVSRKGKKISVVSFGKRKPLASNTTPAGRRRTAASRSRCASSPKPAEREVLPRL